MATDPPTIKDSKAPKTVVRASKYTIVGIILTLFNFIAYTLLTLTIIKDSNFLWLASLVSTTLTAILAFFLHSKITWKERNPGKSGMIKFLLWNLFIAIALSPFLTWLFGFITPLYQALYSLSTFLHLPFDCNFIKSTTIFCIVTLCMMILNYLFYDKIIFKSQSTDDTPKS